MVVAPQTIVEDPSTNILSTSSASTSSIDSALVGLDYIVENSDYVEKLVSALESENIVVKKQVFELLSALCVYNAEGYARTFECLDFYKTKSGERYRFKFIIKELQNGTSSSDYKTAILAFINCLILSTQDIGERIRIRSEFIGLKLLNVLHDLRSKQDADLVVQLDVFDEQKESDESQIEPNTHGIDLSSPLEVFDAIMRQIADTPQEIPFLCILQHLLRIESKEAISDIIWDATERLVHRATLLESSEDALRLFKTQSHAKSLPKLKGSTTNANGDKCTCQCHQKSERNGSIPSTNNNASVIENNNVDNSPLTAPNVMSPPPPPVPSLSQSTTFSGGPPPPPPPANFPPPIPNIPNGNLPKLNLPKLPQQTIPTPTTKMRTINWNKISSGQVLQGNENNLWATFAKTHSNDPIKLDWEKLEGLFCLPNEKNVSPSVIKIKNSNSPVLNPKREQNEIILLDAKRSLNINIFLKQFRRSNEEMIKLIENGCSEDFGSEKLRGLLKIFPLKDEIEMLRSVSEADRSKLASAEKFLFQLTQVRNCQLRIEAMLLKEELDPCINNVEMSINSIFQAAEDVKNSMELQEVIFMILVAGNFLNSGGYAGDAAGLKLSSLQKIADIRGNKPGISLLHFIAMQAESKDSKLVTFVNDMTTLEDASKTNIDQLRNEINSLKLKVTNITAQLTQPNTPQDILQQFSQFLRNAMCQIESLETSFNEIEKVRVDLAHFFCEEVSNFKLEDCFKILFTFSSTWKTVANENERRRIMEKEVEARRQLREEQNNKKRRQTTNQQNFHIASELYNNKNSTTGSNSNITDEILSSPIISKKRLDINGNTSVSHGSNDQLHIPSPDITPNGSLSRRRIRQPSDESETGLMDFLRTTGGDARERQSGSLERSLSARSARRRPNLLELVNVDRERPTSPSPANERASIIPNESEESPTTGRNLREKVSSWFVDMENGGNPVSSTRRPNRLQRRSSNEFGNAHSPGGLSTLCEAEVSDEENIIPVKQTNNGRRPSIKLNTDVVGAMDAIEEARGGIKESSLWRRPSLTFASEENINAHSSATGENGRRRSLIGSLGTNPPKEKLVLYIPQKSAPVTTPTRGLYRQGSTGEEQTVPLSPSNGKNFGTEEGFNRFASIRRSRKIKDPSTQNSKNVKQKFVTKVDIVGEHGKKNIEAKLVSDVASAKLKAIFGPGKARSDSKSILRPLTRSTSIGSTQPRPKIAPTTRGKVISATHEKDEGFEESQSSLSETNSHIESSAHARSNKVPNISVRRGGFREGREAVSTRSIVAAQRAAAASQLQKQSQQIPSSSSKVATPTNPSNKIQPRNSSRSSLLSSRSSLTSQNSIRAEPKKQIPNTQAKTKQPAPSAPKITPSATTTLKKVLPTSKQNGLIRSIPKNEEEKNPSKEAKKTNGEKASSQPKRILSFMRPTASSSARDKPELTAGAEPKKKEAFKRSFK